MKNQKNDRPSKLVVFTAGGKGGTGKTTFACSLTDYYHEHEIDPALYDCDTENKHRGGLAHFFPNARKLNIRSPRGMDDFVDAAVTTPSRIVLADLGAGSGHDTFRWFDDMYGALSEAGIRFTAVVTVTSSSASVETAFTWAQALGPRVRYLIVENEVAGEDFGYLHDTAAGRVFIEAASPKFIRFGRRAPDLQSELENRGLTARSALHASPEARGPYLDRVSTLMRLQGYQRRVEEELKTVTDLLLP
jgi:hypothetical protein